MARRGIQGAYFLGRVVYLSLSQFENSSAYQSDGIISQFEGYNELAEFDWEGYIKKYGDIQRLDRILEAEGDTTNRYKASKQADVLMLFYLFSSEELHGLFKEMEYVFNPQIIPKNIEYYLKRSSNGSTLSNIVLSWVLARSDRTGSWNIFNKANVYKIKIIVTL